MNKLNETRMCTIKMKVPEGKFFGKLYEDENGGYIWRDIEGNLPPPKIDISLFNDDIEVISGELPSLREEQKRKKREYYQKLKSMGICVGCRKMPAVEKKTMCTECLEISTIRSTERRQFYKEHKICVNCGQRDAKPNGLRCVECIAKRKITEVKPGLRTDEQKRRDNELSKQRRYTRKSQGICVKCGKKKAEANKTKCLECLRKRVISESAREKINQKKREEYQQLKSEGICIRCKRVNATAGTTMCTECSNKENARSKVERQFLKDHHLCVRCGQRKAEPNRVSCLECSIKQMELPLRVRTEEQKTRIREKQKKQRYDRKAAGICISCGKHKAERGKATCPECLLRGRKNYKSKKECPNMDRSERPSYGMCYICGEPVKEGKKLCEKHYASARNSIAYASRFVDRAKHYWRADNNIAFAKKCAEI